MHFNIASTSTPRKLYTETTEGVNFWRCFRHASRYFFLWLLRSFQALLRGFGLVGGGISINNTHVVNNVCPLCPEVYDDDTSLLLSYVLCRVLFELIFTSTYGKTYVNFGVVTHMCGGEGLACKVRNSITDLVATRRNEASLIAVEDVADVKLCAISITIFR